MKNEVRLQKIRKRTFLSLWLKEAVMTHWTAGSHNLKKKKKKCDMLVSAFCTNWFELTVVEPGYFSEATLSPLCVTVTCMQQAKTTQKQRGAKESADDSKNKVQIAEMIDSARWENVFFRKSRLFQVRKQATRSCERVFLSSGVTTPTECRAARQWLTSPSPWPCDCGRVNSDKKKKKNFHWRVRRE